MNKTIVCHDNDINQMQERTNVTSLKQVRLNRLAKKASPWKRFLLLPDKNNKLKWTEVNFVTKNTDNAKKYECPPSMKKDIVELWQKEYGKNIYYIVPAKSIKLNSGQFLNFMLGKSLKQTKTWIDYNIDEIGNNNNDLPDYYTPYTPNDDYAKVISETKTFGNDTSLPDYWLARDIEKQNNVEKSWSGYYLKNIIIIQREDIKRVDIMTPRQELKVCDCNILFVTTNNKQFRCGHCNRRLRRNRGINFAMANNVYYDHKLKHYQSNFNNPKRLTLKQYQTSKEMNDSGNNDMN